MYDDSNIFILWLMHVLRSLRPEQWLKNIVVFAALIFSAQLTNVNSLILTAAGFCVFCMLSSAIYLFNDICDRERDLNHPVKKLRPIASGAVSVSMAGTIAVILILIGLISALLINKTFLLAASCFLLLNIFYSLALKQIVIIDVMSIAMGFVIRAVAGGYAIKVHISPWLVLCTFLLALFLGLSKRRHEFILLDQGASEHRKLLKEYSPYFLDQMISIVTTSTLILYILYTMLGELKVKMNVQNLELTIPFVLYGIFRYLYLVHKKSEGGSPARTFFHDPSLLINVILWSVVAIFLIYG
ncbi:MAG: decaprenyl-phosphate phosphoribosyltransferase [bacterium]